MIKDWIMRIPARAIAAFMASIFALSGPAAATKRALLIGISTYEQITTLDNPSIDVVSIGRKLSGEQYIVNTVTDPHTTRNELISAFDNVPTHDQ
jgi:hypothetical protein